MKKSSEKREGNGRIRRITEKIAAALLSAVLLCMLLPTQDVRAEELPPFIDISTAFLTVSPQSEEAEINVAARNMDIYTELAVSVADGNICSVDWVDPQHGYKKLLCKRGEVLGETVVTVYVKDNPAISRQITIYNKNVADGYSYEGNGDFLIYGLNMAEIPYQIHAVSDTPGGYFGLISSDTGGNVQVLMNESGAFDAVTTLEKGTTATSFQILSSGHWQMTITPVLVFEEKNQAGTGDFVSGRFRGDDEMHDIYCTNIDVSQKGNFIVWLYDINDGTKTLLANGVGTLGKNNRDIYLNKSHSYYVSVKSAGNWMIEFKD